MVFWIVVGLVAALCAALVLRPLLAPPPPGPPEPPDLALYRAQMAELDRDVARGLLLPSEAERARAEVGRRLLLADRAGPRPERPAPPRATLLAAAVAGAALVLGSLWAYADLGAPGRPDEPREARLLASAALLDARPSQEEAEALFPTPPPTGVDAETLALVERLRQVVPTRPDDLEGWTLLARNEWTLGQFAAAARAQGRVVELKGEAATPDDLAAWADALVLAAGGLVTEEAEAALARLQALDAAHPALLYYSGLLDLQVGRPDLAFPVWRALVEGPDSPYRRPALDRLPDVAWLAGRNWTPPVPAPEPPPGPSEADLAAAADMDPAAREEMIRGMVEGLAARLDAEGGTAEDWARLVRARATLGDEAGARAALEAGRAALGDDPALRAAAEEAGL